jgi:hypothetical protein
VQAVLQQDVVKIHQQRGAATAQAQVGQHLGLMDGQDALNGFEFEQHGVVHDDVGPVAVVDAHVFVENRERDLVFERQTGVVQFPAKALVIDGFQ